MQHMPLCMVQVAVAVYRKLPRLSPAPQLLPIDVFAASPPLLNIPECSDPAASSTTGLFQPCKPIGTAAAETVPVDSTDPARGHVATLQLQLEILPGLLALAELQQRCLRTNAFALGGDVAQVYLAARDTGSAGRQHGRSCSGAAGGDDGVPLPAKQAEVHHSGILIVQCRCVKL